MALSHLPDARRILCRSRRVGSVAPVGPLRPWGANDAAADDDDEEVTTPFPHAERGAKASGTTLHQKASLFTPAGSEKDASATHPPERHRYTRIVAGIAIVGRRNLCPLLATCPPCC